MSQEALYLKHSSGATHEYSARRVAHLKKEILAGRGGREVTTLVESGYVGYLGRSGDIEEFESLDEYFAPKTS